MELSIIFLPLIASIISGFFGKYIGDRNSEIVTSLLVSISALLSIFSDGSSVPISTAIAICGVLSLLLACTVIRKTADK